MSPASPASAPASGSTCPPPFRPPPLLQSATAVRDAEELGAGDTVRHDTTVLYIEDNPANLKLVAQMFSLRPRVRLLSAPAPELGISLALAHRPDLILLDINLPGLDGYQVMEIFRADAVLRAIPVVAVTANAMPRDIERGRAAGFAAYLTKPLDVGTFLQTIDAMIGTPPQRDGRNRPQSAS
jgi:CheY-like chemotaxis protein